jgi:hypothetical protein
MMIQWKFSRQVSFGEKIFRYVSTDGNAQEQGFVCLENDTLNSLEQSIFILRIP